MLSFLPTCSVGALAVWWADSQGPVTKAVTGLEGRSQGASVLLAFPCFLTLLQWGRPLPPLLQRSSQPHTAHWGAAGFKLCALRFYLQRDVLEKPAEITFIQ